MSTTDGMNFPKFMEDAVKAQIEKEAESLIKEASEKLIERMPEIVARTTIEVMKFAEFQTMQDRVVFTIKNNQ